MFRIIYIPSQTVHSEYALVEDAQRILSVIQTPDQQYEIVEVPNGDN